MLRSHLKQFGLFACAVGVIGLSAFASQHVWRENGLKSLQAARIAKVISTVLVDGGAGGVLRIDGHPADRIDLTGWRCVHKGKET